jgi:hypothetical protein
MELLDDEQSKKQVKNHSTLIVVLSILTLVGSLVQSLYLFVQINSAQLIINLNEDWPQNFGGFGGGAGNGLTSFVEIYQFRLIGYYIWIGSIVFSLIAAILFLTKRKAGNIFYTIGSVVFIISSILFFLVLGDISKAMGGGFSVFSNLIEIGCIISSLVFLFLYSMNYKKHCNK